MITFYICHKKYLFKTAGDEFFIRQIFAIASRFRYFSYKNNPFLSIIQTINCVIKADFLIMHKKNPVLRTGFLIN